MIRSCKHEIKEYSCKKVIIKESKNAVKLSQILLCLEENIRDGREVSGQCVAEIKQIRREMMEDCSDTKTQRQGQTIHCLMRLVSEQQNPDTKVVVVVSDKCKKALDSLLRQTQVMMDWRADAVLKNGK